MFFIIFVTVFINSFVCFCCVVCWLCGCLTSNVSCSQFILEKETLISTRLPALKEFKYYLPAYTKQKCAFSPEF